MTDQQQIFVNHYCTDANQNATKAYRMAGYSTIGADGNSARLMVKDSIKQAIAVKMAGLKEKIGHNYEIAVEMLRERLGWLNEMAGKGNVQAIQAQTAIIRELNDITGLHKQTIITEPQQRELDEAEKAESLIIASIRLHQESA